MKKKVTKKNHNTVENKLKTYSALAAGLMIFTNSSEAQIVVKTLKPDTTISDNGTYLLDLNGDGIPNFQLSQMTSISSNPKSSHKYNRVTIAPYGQGDKILDTILKNGVSSANPYPPALNLNTSIGPNLKNQHAWTSSGTPPLTLNSERMLLSSSGKPIYPGKYQGHWKGVKDKYIGVQIQVNNKAYFGWIRLDVAANAKSFTIKSYAWDSIPNESILAGDTVITGIAKNNELPVKTVIYTHSKDLYINFSTNEPVTGTINLYNMTGQNIKSSVVEGDRNTVKLDDIAAGIYILNIQTTKGVITRKIQIG